MKIKIDTNSLSDSDKKDFEVAEKEDNEMNRENLDMILKLHKMWLNDYVDGERADLSGVVLRGVDLAGADLRHADFSKADLTGANLEGANLMFAKFRWTNLSGANLNNAHFTEASLVGANLEKTSLIKAWFKEADLISTNLKNANLASANLRQATLWDADLSDANLQKACLYHADLSGANLSNADLSDADLVWAVFDNANLDGAIIHEKPYACPKTGSFVGFTVAENGDEDVVVELQILEDAKRMSGVTDLCRCDKVKVLSITSPDGAKSYDEASVYRTNLVYVVGEVITIDNFDNNRWTTSTGIKFFVSREKALSYFK